MKTKTLEQQGINTVRILAADAVRKANSGHPGTPMWLAPVGHVLWSESFNVTALQTKRFNIIKSLRTLQLPTK